LFLGIFLKYVYEVGVGSYMNGGVMILHFNFIKDLVISVAYLIPLLIFWRLRGSSSDEVASPLNYVLAGFLVGFLVRFVGSLFYNYVIQIPLLPVKLHEEGVPFEFIARTMALYDTAFTITYIVSLFTSLLLITYGVYRLVTILR